MIGGDSDFFCNEGSNRYIDIRKIDSNNSYLKCGSDFSGRTTEELIGADSWSKTKFTTKRLIVIEMK